MLWVWFKPKKYRQISQAGMRLMSSCILAQLKSDVFFRGLYTVSGFWAQKLRGYESSTIKTWILRLPSWRFFDSFHLHPAIYLLINPASQEAKNRQNVGNSTSDPQMRCVSGHINLRLQMQQDQVLVVSRAEELNISKDPKSFNPNPSRDLGPRGVVY